MTSVYRNAYQFQCEFQRLSIFLKLMNNAGKSNDERIVAYAVQNGRTPSFMTIAGMKLASTVKSPANPESEV